MQHPPTLRPQALQSLYVCTGCDYTSYFVGVGKCTFLVTFFQYASFIASGSDPPGSKGLVSLNRDDLSFYSFINTHTSGHIHQLLWTLHQCHSTIP